MSKLAEPLDNIEMSCIHGMETQIIANDAQVRLNALVMLCASVAHTFYAMYVFDSTAGISIFHTNMYKHLYLVMYI